MFAAAWCLLAALAVASSMVLGSTRAYTAVAESGFRHGIKQNERHKTLRQKQASSFLTLDDLGCGPQRAVTPVWVKVVVNDNSGAPNITITHDLEEVRIIRTGLVESKAFVTWTVECPLAVRLRDRHSGHLRSYYEKHSSYHK